VVKSYSEKEANKIRDEFQGLVERLTGDEFWGYVRTRMNARTMWKIMSGWNLDTKKDSIKELKEILAKRKPEKKPNCRDCAHLIDKDEGSMGCELGAERFNAKGICKRFKNKG